jgi:hypothetical protein
LQADRRRGHISPLTNWFVAVPAGRKRASPDVAKDSRKADTKRRKSSKGAKQQQKEEEEDEEQQEEDAPASDADVDVAAAADADASEDGGADVDADAGGIGSCRMVLTLDSPCSDSPAWGVVSCMGRGVRRTDRARPQTYNCFLSTSSSDPT